MSDAPTTPLQVAEARLDEAQRVAAAYQSLHTRRKATVRELLAKGWDGVAAAYDAEAACGAQLAAARLRVTEAAAALQALQMGQAA